MTRNEVINEYFEWMCHLVSDDRRCISKSYHNLLCHLHSRDFIFSIDMDDNRASDGIDLRYRFSYEKGYIHPMIATYLDDRPCSILEMLVAMCIRCEEFMDDPDIGNRTGEWFWDMIENLGLCPMDDTHFDEEYVNEILDIFMNREYEPNGRGGLFTIENCKYDLRTVEIWYQLMWHLDDVSNN